MGTAAPPRNASCGLAEVLDDPDELVQPVALKAGEVDELPRSGDDGSTLGSTGDGDPASSSKFEEPLVAEYAQRPKDGVRVDPENGSEVLGRREALAGLRLPLCNRSSEL